MVTEQLGRFHGFWVTSPEIVSEMLHVVGNDDAPCVVGGIFEGMVLRDKRAPTLVFEVLLADLTRQRFYLIEV